VFNRRKLYKRILIDEEFDDREPMARAIRSLMPDDSSMDPEARDRLVGHLCLLRQRRKRDRYTHVTIPLRRALVVATVFALSVVVTFAAQTISPFGRGTAPEKPREVARISKLSGAAEVLVPGRRWREASSEDRLAEGWSIRTGVGSSVAVCFPDMSIMRVTDGSEARVSKLAPRDVEIEHVSGSTYHRVHKGTRYVVSNSGVSSETRGATFNVENRVSGRLEVLAVESAVDVSINSHKPIEVSQGEVMTISMAQEKKADKQPVSRERLNEGRLMASIRQDVDAGFSTGIYEKLDILASPPSASPTTQPEQPSALQLAGEAAGSRVTLTWAISGDVTCKELVLLRSEGAQPICPDNEIARYSDTSISSANDDAIESGRTYQYRLAAVPEGSEDIVYSNTVVVNVPAKNNAPAPVSVSLTATPVASGVTVEWSVQGASRFGGFVLERVVARAPDGSPTPAGNSTTRRFELCDVFYSCLDDSVLPGHAYNYRVGLVVDGAVMVYSQWEQAKLTR